LLGRSRGKNRQVRRIDKIVAIVSVSSFVSHSDVKAGSEPVVRDSKELVVQESIVHGAHSHSEHEVAEG